MPTALSKNYTQNIFLLAGFFSVGNCRKPSHLASVVEMHVCLYLFQNRIGIHVGPEIIAVEWLLCVAAFIRCTVYTHTQ